MEPPLATIESTMGCSDFGDSIALPSYYQAEDKYESLHSFLSLAEVSAANWTRLWEPVTSEFVKIPKLLGPPQRQTCNS